jgi:hypothetical protein
MNYDPRSIIFTTFDAGGLGDHLLFTPVCKHKKDLTVLIHKNYKRFSFLFENLCKEIIIVDTFPGCRHVLGDGLFVDRFLRYYDLYGKDNIPYIEFKGSEALNIIVDSVLRKYKKPIVFKPNCSGRWKHFRQYPSDFWVDKLLKLKEDGYDILSFGISENYTYCNNVDEHFLDLDVQLLSVFYRKIGKYIGVNTGDEHLMLAVGGCAVVYEPNDYEMINVYGYNSDRIKYIRT